MKEQELDSDYSEFEENTKALMDSKKSVMNAGVASMMQKVDKLQKGLKGIGLLTKRFDVHEQKIQNLFDKTDLMQKLSEQLYDRIDQRLQSFQKDQDEMVKNRIYDSVHDKVTLKLFNSEMDQVASLKDYTNLLESFNTATEEIQRFRQSVLPGYRKEVDVRFNSTVTKSEFQQLKQKVELMS